MFIPMPESDCARARESVSARLDGELTDLEAGFLELHLRDCVACAGYAEDVEGAAGLVRATPLLEPSEPVFVARRRHYRRLPVSSAAAAAAVVVAAVAGSSFVIGSLLGSQGGQRGQHPATTRKTASGSPGPAARNAPVILRGQPGLRLRVPAAGRVIVL